MAITFTESSATIGTTEYSLPNGSTTLTPQTTDYAMQTWIDFSALAAGDEYSLQVYEKVTAAGSQLVAMSATITGPQTEAYVMPSLLLGNGWDITLTKVTGTDRAIGWSMRTVA